MVRKYKRPISYIEPNWNGPSVRDDVMIQSNFRMPERLMLKIDWIAAMRGVSKRQAIEDALAAYAEAELRKHGLD